MGDLEERRRKNRLSMLYKIQHGLVDINRQEYLHPNGRRTRGENRFFQERTNNDVYGNSFFPRTFRDWNQLPTSVTSADTVEGFRAALKARSERN